MAVLFLGQNGIDENGLSWLATAPKIKLLPDTEKRQPYPLNWDEQACLFKELPAHLGPMALFAVNTGCRDGEVCALRWDWEVQVPELGTFVFIVPGRLVKNGDDRLIVLNRIAKSVVEAQRGQHATHVFTYKGRPTTRMLNKAWLRAREAAGLPQVRVHDLKHTFGRRLRAAGVSFEDRQDLLGWVTVHRGSPPTTPPLSCRSSSRRRIVCVNPLTGGPSSWFCGGETRRSSRQIPTMFFCGLAEVR